MKRNLLNRDDVRAVLRFKNPPRPATALTLWHNAETLAYYGGEFERIMKAYPDDVVHVPNNLSYWDSPADDPDYRWAFGQKIKPADVAIDACPVISDWRELSQFLAELPDPCRADAVAGVVNARAQNPDRYILASWGHYFHQRLAYIRGIENLLFDFSDYQDKLRLVMDALLQFYEIWAKRFSAAGADGVWAGDDLGMQSSLFMSPDVFRAIYKPYYIKLGNILHANCLDFWLHTCGNVTEIMDDLIDAGVDAIHPIQAGCMDEDYIAARYKGQISFWLGMDVQNLIPFGSVEDVRAGVRKRIEKFYSRHGGLIIASGNALMAGIPCENIYAYMESLDEFCCNC